MNPILPYAAFLVAYGNAKARLLGPSPAGSLAGVGAGLLVSGIVAAWSRAAGLDAHALGIGLRRESGAAGNPRDADDTVKNVQASSIGGSIRTGLLWGLGLGVFPLAAAALHLLPPDRPEATGLWPLFLRRIVLYLPLDTVLPEELAFRGLLLGWLLRAGGVDLSRRPAAPLPAPPCAASQLTGPLRGGPDRWLDLLRGPATWLVLVAAVPFVLWHLTLAWTEMRRPRLSELAGKLVGYFLGGVVFGCLRVGTGHLAGSMAAHWLFNALAMVAARTAARQ